MTKRMLTVEDIMTTQRVNEGHRVLALVVEVYKHDVGMNLASRGDEVLTCTVVRYVSETLASQQHCRALAEEGLVRQDRDRLMARFLGPHGKAKT